MEAKDNAEKASSETSAVEDVVPECSDIKAKGARLNVDFEAINNEIPELNTATVPEKREEENRSEESPVAEIVQEERLIAETVDIKNITSEDRYRISDADARRGNLPAVEDASAPSMTPGSAVSAVVSTLDRQQVVRRDSTKMVRRDDSLFSNRMVINRYPGRLYVEINQIERFLGSSDVESVSVRVESKTFNYETRKIKASTTIEINEMLEIPIEKIDDEGFTLRFILVTHHRRRGILFTRESTKTCEVSLPIDSNRIYSVHNNLVENVSRWDHYVSSNLLKNFGSLFTASSPDAWSLRTYLSFLSDDEIPFIPAQVPNDLRSLSKWLTVKKFSYNMWYRGFVNLRGDVPGILTHLWKRRYVKCYGYSIFIFNEHSKNLIGTINLADASFDPDVQKGLYFENFIKLSFRRNIIEMHFDSKAKYNAALGTLGTMLPKAIFSFNK
jgi:hypothetical protein